MNRWVLVADDSPSMRQLLCRALAGTEGRRGRRESLGLDGPEPDQPGVELF